MVSPWRDSGVIRTIRRLHAMDAARRPESGTPGSI